MQDSVIPSPPTTPSAPPIPEPASSPVKEMLKKWLVYRIPAFLAWAWLVLRLLKWQIPIDVRIEPYLIAPAVAVFVILVFSGRWANAFGYPLYLAFAPTLVILLPIGVVISLVTNSTEASSYWVKAVARILAFVRSGKFIFLQCVIVAATWASVGSYAPPEYRPQLALSAHVVGYLVFLQSFRWAANPYRPILFALTVASNLFAKIIEKLFFEANMKKKRDERSNAILTCESIRLGLRKLHDPTSETIHGITAVTHGYLSAIFTIVFFLIYVGVAVSFAAALFELEKGWGTLISGIGSSDLMGYFYFSFLSQATAIPDGVQPLGMFGRLWIIWLVMTGLLSLTGLITLFTSSAGVYSETSLSQIDTLFSDLENKIVGWQTQLIQQPDPAE